VDALSITNLYEYGTDKRLARVRRAGAVLATLQYDAAGRLTNYTGPEGVSMAAAFDGLDRMTNLAVGAESPYRWTYPTNSLLLGQVADRSGRRSQFSYDVMNRLAGVKSPDYSLTTFEYDNADNLSALIDAEVHRTRFAYDSRERPIRKTYADGASNQVSWTSRSLLNTFVSPRGITNAYAYDASGLLTNVAYSGITNTPNVRFRYDSYNRLTNSVDGWATNRLTYDLLGRLTVECRIAIVILAELLS
jgi:YD repeat-containing protein